MEDAARYNKTLLILAFYFIHYNNLYLTYLISERTVFLLGSWHRSIAPSLLVYKLTFFLLMSIGKTWFKVDHPQNWAFFFPANLKLLMPEQHFLLISCNDFNLLHMAISHNRHEAYLPFLYGINLKWAYTEFITSHCNTLQKLHWTFRVQIPFSVFSLHMTLTLAVFQNKLLFFLC